MMDLTSRLRAIVRSGPAKPGRELTYEPDAGGYEAAMDLSRVGEILGGRTVDTPFGACLVVDRRYESDRWHGGVQIGECEVHDCGELGILDPSLPAALESSARPHYVTGGRRTIFIDLETTGLSGGAGTVAFLVGCGFFDVGAFQVRQFLLTSHSAERALLHAVAQFFEGADLIVTYNGKTFDVPVMETRWLFHRIQMPLDGVAHFDMLHPARRLWRVTSAAGELVSVEGGCRLTTLERVLFEVRRIGDVDGFEIPGRFFHFLRSGDPRPLEPVLEHNRLDLVSLAAVMGRAVRLAREGHASCRDAGEALALGRVFERADIQERAEACYRCAAESTRAEVKGEALYRIGLKYRRERRFAEAAAIWREVIALTGRRDVRRLRSMAVLRQFAAEALAIHHEHRERDFNGARELALFALEDADAAPRRYDAVRHRLARLDRKIQKKKDAQQLSVLQD
jgi:uncharacterized protein YprB with RNaseH-like and TPR domain